MSKQNNEIVSILRAQAWSRAKGELNSLLDTHRNHNTCKCVHLQKSLIEFIEYIENNNLHKG